MGDQKTEKDYSVIVRLGDPRSTAAAAAAAAEKAAIDARQHAGRARFQTGMPDGSNNRPMPDGPKLSTEGSGAAVQVPDPRASLNDSDLSASRSRLDLWAADANVNDSAGFLHYEL